MVVSLALGYIAYLTDTILSNFTQQFLSHVLYTLYEDIIYSHLFSLNLKIKNMGKRCTPKTNVLFCYHPNASLFQYVCRFSLMHLITTEKPICSFQRIFFKNAFHQILRVASSANLSVKRARFSL